LRHVLSDAHVVGVKEKRGASGVGDLADRHDVIKVGVAREDAGDFDAHVAGEGENLVGFVAGVYDHGLTALPRANDPAVFAEEANDHTADLEFDCFAGHGRFLVSS
jgi:hypothetical protein